ncbi:MAG: alpha/beta fold hydrolase [Anaerolineae bacterium]
MITNIIIGLIGLVLILIIIGMLYEFVESRRARRFYDDVPGERVDMGGYALHIKPMGHRQAGQPAVILEASVGANSLDWQMVQPLIAERAQVISYDRAGNGWSDTAPDPRTPDQLADDLHRLLTHAGIAPPYLLVGHRYGGMYVRKYQEKYPEQVVGLVLVDASHPEIFNEEDNRAEISRLERNVSVFQRLGLVRMVTRRNNRVTHLDEALQAQYVAMMMHDNANLLAEAKPILLDGITLPDSLDIPLTVVSRAEDLDLQQERRWAEFQRDLANLSPQNKHVHTETTRRWIVFAEPHTIADAVLDTLTPHDQTDDEVDQ